MNSTYAISSLRDVSNAGCAPDGLPEVTYRSKNEAMLGQTKVITKNSSYSWVAKMLVQSTGCRNLFVVIDCSCTRERSSWAPTTAASEWSTAPSGARSIWPPSLFCRETWADSELASGRERPDANEAASKSSPSRTWDRTRIPLAMGTLIRKWPGRDPSIAQGEAAIQMLERWLGTRIPKPRSRLCLVMRRLKMCIVTAQNLC